MEDVQFKVGDTIKVLTKDTQEKRVHSQSFEGIVISFRGEKNNKTFIVRKKGADGVFVEKIFPLNAPVIEKIVVVKNNKVRRAKLFYLRKKTS